jgi:AcrR family transcriptional regulator
MPASKPSPSTGRAPQRANGVKRREAIMDAAAAIIAESGVAGLTLHATARRAGASIGSTYHFFGDKEQLLDALRERHRHEMLAMVANLHTIGAEVWKAMSTAEVIDQLFGKPIRYYEEHPSALDLHKLDEERTADAFLELVEIVMALRLGTSRGTQVGRMLYALSTGTLSFLLDGRKTGRMALIAQIPAALTAYLASQDALVA